MFSDATFSWHPAECVPRNVCTQLDYSLRPLNIGAKVQRTTVDAPKGRCESKASGKFNSTNRSFF